MIKKIKGKGFCLMTSDGSKIIACHSTLAEAQKQERAIRSKQAKKSYSLEDKVTNKLELTVIPVPVIPTIPNSPTMLRDQDGKPIVVDNEMIKGFLAFDPDFRDAYLYYNEESAHNKKGKTNLPVIARFLKTYDENGIGYADAELQQLYTDPEEQKKWEEKVK